MEQLNFTWEGLFWVAGVPAIFATWAFTTYRVLRLPWLKWRPVLLLFCFVPFYYQNDASIHVAMPVAFPLVLIWTFLFPGRKPENFYAAGR
jgi:hypothetical protein